MAIIRMKKMTRGERQELSGVSWINKKAPGLGQTWGGMIYDYVTTL